MTCQWCIYFRQHKGRGVCTCPERDGNIVPAKTRNVCEQFHPRRNCSTCEFRCPIEERVSSGGSFGECDRWKLRSISTWGGSRKRAKTVSKISGSPGKSTSTTLKEGEKV
jgi:hypothetical protein